MPAGARRTAENGAPPLPGEAQLQRAWAEGPLPQPLLCLDGEPLRVIFRGRANSGPGPDFRDALFLGPDRRAFGGDVELHRRLSDWWAHGHHRDPAYARVALHVVAEADARAAARRAELGRIAPAWSRAHRRPAAPNRRPGPRRRTVLLLLRAHAPAPRAHRRPAAPGPATAARQGGLAPRGACGARRCARQRTRQRTRRRPRLAARPGCLPGPAVRLRGGAPPARGARRPRSPRQLRASPAARRRPIRHPRSLRRLRPPRRPQWCAGRAALEALAEAPLQAALRELRGATGLGGQRATQLLVDAAYPFALAAAPRDASRLERRWLALPGARYGRTEALRGRLTEAGLRDWRNGSTQGLLDLERGYCARGAAAVCPSIVFEPPPALSAAAAGASAGVGREADQPATTPPRRR